jgi:hypothetical protein
MNLIDRYIHEVGRRLPRRNRSDIQAELRSLLTDTLEDRTHGEPTENDIVALLKEFGPPQKVAASYAPEGQYLIGPALYPLFRMVVSIALAAIIGAQILAVGVGLIFDNTIIQPLEALSGLLSSLPATFGTVVIVFAILQWFDVRPESKDEPWDPRSLPQIEDSQDVNRGERIFGIIAGSVVLALLLAFPDRIGIYTYPGGTFFANPVIAQYLGLITFSLLASIGLDIYLLWQGRWSSLSRVARIAANLLSMAVLYLLFQGHNAWLAERGVSGFITSIERLAEDAANNWQIVGMQAFRMAFGIALLVTIIETLVELYRMVKTSLSGEASSRLAV